jgi:hypothetical protein
MHRKATTAEVAAFIDLYRMHLSAPDCKSGRIAYLRAEADFSRETSKRRYRNYDVFRAAMCNYHRRARQNRRRREIVNASR